jgi:hypothetical protein
MAKYLDENGLLYFWGKIKAWVTNQGYTKNTGTITSVTTTAGAHTAINVSSGGVSFKVPTQTSHLTNNSNFVSDANYVHTDSNYTAAEKTKLEGIESGAEENVVKSVDTTASHGIALTLGNSTGELGISVSQGVIGANQSAFVSGGRIYDYVTTQLIPNLAPIASPAFTGTPTAPTPTSSSGQTQIANVAFVEDRIMAAIESITGIDFQIVSSLPASGTKGVIYLVPNSGTNPNSYDEYIWITPSGDTGRFEKIGTTDVDLSGYLQISSVITNAEIDAIVAN